MTARSGGSSKTRLLIVDDHAFIRTGVEAILYAEAPFVEVVGEAKDGEEALVRSRELRPDLILMDVSMPKMDGIEATRLIKAEFPKTSVLVLTGYADQDLLMDAIRAGAAGYIVKDANPTRVVDAIRAVLDGEMPLDQALVVQVLRRLAEETGSQTQPIAEPAARKPAVSLSGRLTPREAEVLGHLAEGKTNRQIAQDLHLSLSTVKTHLEHIISKLGVSDRTQAAVKAVELGLLPGDARDGGL